MLLLVVLWLLLACSTLCIGYALLAWLDHDSRLERMEDRFFAALWIGVLVAAILLETLSLFRPLAGMGYLLFGMAALVVGFSPRIRGEIVAGVRQLPLSAFVALLASGLYAAQPVFWFDTGLYHAQLIKWLAEYGAVVGLGQWHVRFAFLSSWFALPAAVEVPAVAGRVSTLMGGYALLLMLVHGMCALRAIAAGRALSQDIFLIAAAGLAMPLVLAYGMAISPSPDLPVILLPILVVWMLLSFNAKMANPAILFTVAGTLALKTSALPLLLVVSVSFMLCHDAMSMRRRVRWMVTVFALLVAPHLAALFQVSGCLLFPMAASCFDVPWGLGAEEAVRTAHSITEWARWNGNAPTNASSLEWLRAWWAFGPENRIFLGLLLGSVFLTLFAWRKLLRDHPLPLVIAWFGTGFVLMSAPVLRFGMGYLVIVPALAVVVMRARWPLGWRGLTVLTSMSPWLVAALPLLFMVLHVNPFQRAYYLAIDAGQGPNAGELRINLLVPPVLQGVVFTRSSAHKYEVVGMASPVFSRRKNGDFFIFMPDGASDDLCWNAPLPCVPDFADLTHRRPTSADFFHAR